MAARKAKREEAVSIPDSAAEFVGGGEDPSGMSLKGLIGHICFSVPDLDGAVRWLDENKLTYVKRPEQGKMRDVAFVKDPDGYWIEIVEPARLKSLGR